MSKRVTHKELEDAYFKIKNIKIILETRGGKHTTAIIEIRKVLGMDK